MTPAKMLNTMKTVRVAITTKSNRKTLRLLFLSSIIFTLIGCQTNKDSSSLNSQLSSKACLERLVLTDLQKSLDNCSEIIKNNPNSPEALNSRALIYLLLEQESLACKDITKGLELIKSQKGRKDTLLIYELNIRHANCMQRRTISGRD